jgi:2,6-dihydroxypyridine 3-monooxygenase
MAAIDRISVATAEVRYIDRRGDVLSELEAPYRLASYDAIYDSLLSRLDRTRYHLGHEVVAASATDEGATLTFADGHVHEADILVWADGIRSLGRSSLAPQASRQYAGYVAWRGTADPRRLSGPTSAVLARAITYFLGESSHLLAYPIRQCSGTIALNWLWYRNTRPGAELETQMAKADGGVGDVSVAPGHVAPQTLVELRNATEHELPEMFRELLGATTHPFPQAVFDLHVSRMAFGSACLVGDAAFVVRPHVAAGAAKATADTYELARALAENPGATAEALHRWEAPQLALGRSLIERNREAGERLQFRSAWRPGDRLPYGLYAEGDSQMRADSHTAAASVGRPAKSRPLTHKH